MGRIDHILSARNEVAKWYSDHLSGVEKINPPELFETTTTMSWFVYVARLDKGVDRDNVISRLFDLGIPSRPYFPPIHLLPFYREKFGYKLGDFPIAEEVSAQTIALPFYTSMPEEEVAYVCSTLNSILNK